MLNGADWSVSVRRDAIRQSAVCFGKVRAQMRRSGYVGYGKLGRAMVRLDRPMYVKLCSGVAGFGRAVCDPVG